MEPAQSAGRFCKGAAMNDTIKFQGRKWRLESATETRLIFHPAKSEAGEALKRWRKANKMNQRTAAEKLGISQTHLAKIELGDRNCPPEVLNAIQL